MRFSEIENQFVDRVRKGADRGSAQNQYMLGVMYATGRQVSKDAKEAVKLFHKAAEQGHANDQCNLGVMYAIGKWVLEDEREALK